MKLGPGGNSAGGSAGGAAHLTYCTNIHPGETWPEVAYALKVHLPAVKAQFCPRRYFVDSRVVELLVARHRMAEKIESAEFYGKILAELIELRPMDVLPSVPALLETARVHDVWEVGSGLLCVPPSQKLNVTYRSASGIVRIARRAVLERCSPR